jgi:hypothetical protein
LVSSRGVDRRPNYAVVVVVVVESLHTAIHCEKAVPQAPGPLDVTQMKPEPHCPSDEQPWLTPPVLNPPAHVGEFELQRVSGSVAALYWFAPPTHIPENVMPCAEKHGAVFGVQTALFVVPPSAHVA